MTLCDAHSFDLILLDIQMPVLDGFETLRKIRKGSSRNTDCLIFALTAYSGPREIAQIKRAGFSAVLTKPFRSADMYAFLNGSGRGQAVPTVGTSTLLTTVHNGPPDLQAVTVEPLLAMPILNELRAAAGTARVRHIAKVFWKDVAEILARILRVRLQLELTNPQSDTDIDTLRKAAHALKGAAANIGLMRVSRLSARLQNAPIAQIPPLLIAIEKALRESKAALQTYLDTEDS